MSSGSINEVDLLGTPDEVSTIEHGTIGWDGETGDHADPGTQDASNGNVTLVKVQLYRGRDHSVPLKPERAQGHRIVCRLATPSMGIPPKGCQCFVAFPNGYTDVVGIGVIFATPGNPRDAMNDAFMRTSDDRKLTFMTTTADGHTVSFQVRPDGFRFVSPWGTLTLDATGFHYKHVSGCRIDLGALAGVPVVGSTLKNYATISGDMMHVEGAVVALGTEAGEPEPVVKGVSLLAYLGALEGAIATALAATTAPTFGVAGAAAFAAAVTTALTPLKLLLGSSTTGAV